MAFSGIHMVCSAVAEGHVYGALPSAINWAQTTSATGAVGSSPPQGQTPSLIRCYVSADSYVGIATNSSDAITASTSTSGSRHFIPANGTHYDFYAKPGDFFAWTPA